MVRLKCFFCSRRTYCMKKHIKKCSQYRQLSPDVLLHNILPHFRYFKLTKYINKLCPRFFRLMRKNNLAYRSDFKKNSTIRFNTRFLIPDDEFVYYLSNKKRVTNITIIHDYNIFYWEFYYKRNGWEVYKIQRYIQQYLVPPQAINLYHKIHLIGDRLKSLILEYRCQ